MKKGTLSVVVCNYNHARYLPESLQAILDQSYRPLEVIVIDDGSTDNSVEVIEEFARKDPIVHLYRNEQNQGVHFSANRGLHLAVGEYIYWGAADDRICPGLFEKSMELLVQYPQAGLCSALVKQIRENGEDKGWVKSVIVSRTPCFLPPEKVLSTLTRYIFWYKGQTAILRRDVVLRETGGLMPELRQRADYFVSMVVALKCGACFIPEVLGTWRIMDAGFSMTIADNVELSRSSFEKMVQLMRSPKYAALFTEEYTTIWEHRDLCRMELHNARKLIRDQRHFLARLRTLRPRPTLLDRGFFALLELVTMTGGLVAKVYLGHRLVNWDIPWLARMLRSRHFKLPS